MTLINFLIVDNMRIDVKVLISFNIVQKIVKQQFKNQFTIFQNKQKKTSMIMQI
jgi:hypothetical protein